MVSDDSIYSLDIDIKLNTIELKDSILGFSKESNQIDFQDVKFGRITSMYAKGSKYILGTCY